MRAHCNVSRLKHRALVLKALKIFVGVDNIFLSCVRRVDVEKAAHMMVKTLARRGWIWVQERLGRTCPEAAKAAAAMAEAAPEAATEAATGADLAEGSEAAMEAAATAVEG